MKTLTDTRLLFHRYTVQMLRNPVWLFVGFSTPILYLLLFTPLLHSLPGVRSVRHRQRAPALPSRASSPCWPSPAGRAPGSAPSSSSSPV